MRFISAVLDSFDQVYLDDQRQRVIKWGNRCSARVTSAPTCGLRHQMLTSAPSSIGILTSAQCKTITCAEIIEFFRNLFRSSGAEVHPCRSSFTPCKIVE